MNAVVVGDVVDERNEDVEDDVCVDQVVKDDVYVNQNMKDDVVEKVVEDVVDADLLIEDVAMKVATGVDVNDIVNDEVVSDNDEEDDVKVTT